MGVLVRILDANKYRINFLSIKTFTLNKNKAELLESIGVLAIVTGVPIIIVACYMGEIYGFWHELNLFIERLCQFYQIQDILNVSGCTYAQISQV